MIRRFVFNKKTEQKVLRYISELDKFEFSVADSIVKIVEDVRKNGDKALRKYSKKFDGTDIKEFKVPAGIIKKAYTKIDKKILPSLKKSAANIKRFHKMQKDNIKDFRFNNNGYKIDHKYIPVESAGLYIPGGQAPLFSTVLMAGIPALIAGVENINIVSPPRYDGEVNPYVLVAADIIGIKNIYRVGGAQAIAALSYGTASIPKVNKVVGPGNIYSTMAKKYLFGVIGVDALNGPSEVTVVADETAKPEFVICDLLAQAEHINGHSVLITTSKKLADIVEKELKAYRKKLDLNCTIIEVSNINQAIDIVNYKGPEHLTLVVKKAADAVKKVKNAPAIFCGNYTPVAFGDYMAGANHILPTNGTSKFFSGLSVLDFLKHTHVVECSKQGIAKFGKDTEILATTETLENHRASIAVRYSNKTKDRTKNGKKKRKKA